MTEEERWNTQYAYSVVQIGSLPLNPETEYDRSVEHRCTSILIWPEGDSPSLHNTVLTDPCFTSQGYQYAMQQLKPLKTTFQETGCIFVTHPHRDHCSNLAHFLGQQPGEPFQPGEHQHFEDLVSILLPGHAPTQQGLLFRAASQQLVCVAGDAILNEAWLRAWKYYWPNFYQETEIVQTWRSVAAILAHVDVVIPGHGLPFDVTAELVNHLAQTFAQAEHAAQCPDVLECLEKRYASLT